MPKASLQKWMAQKDIPGELARVMGNPTTFNRRDGRRSAIDHALLMDVPGDAQDEGKTRLGSKRSLAN